VVVHINTTYYSRLSVVVVSKITISND
jgi:hypothetical protein